MNCSSSARQRRLQRLLVQLWQELLQGEAGAGAAPSNFSRHRPAGTDPSSPAPPPCWTWEEEAAAPGGHRAKGSAGGDDAYLYILLIMIFYGCLAGGLILAYTRSRKLESKHDPYHLYIERDWTGRPGDGGGGESGKAAAMAVAPLLREASVDEVAAAAIGPGERRPSGDGEPL